MPRLLLFAPNKAMNTRIAANTHAMMRIHHKKAYETDKPLAMAIKGFRHADLSVTILI
jgi:hypothetical protein